MKNNFKSKEQLLKEVELLNKRVEELEKIEIKHQKAQKELQEHSEIIQSIVETSQDWIWSIDLQGILTYSNSAIESILGYPLDEILGKPSFNLMHEEDSKLIGKKMPDFISEKQGWQGLVIRWKHKNGSWRYLESSAVPIIDKDGNILGFRGVDRDITERKKVQEKVNEALIKAEESEKLKSAFLANMSHEIRTPMNAIIGFSSLMADAKTEEQRLEFIKIITSNGEHLLNIINDLIDISQIEAGIIKIENELCNINRIIESVLDKYRIKNKIKNSDIEINLHKGLPEIKANLLTDGKRLRQILFNLLDNAYKCTDKGNIDYGYVLKQSKDSSDYLEFYVRDTGIGIQKAKQEIIFDRFMQEDTSTTRTIEGTGLGLSIVKAIVQLLGGDIWVKSIIGQGSTFYFTIPYHSRSIPGEMNKSSESEIIDWRNKTILVAEDMADSYYVIESMLEKTQAKAIWAKDGIEAIEICKTNKNINLVLMDLRMPKKNGYLATMEIKEFHHELPIIAQTAYAIKGDKEKALKAGCDDYITKPISSKQLIEKINFWFNKVKL